jgi:hypothetical protein
MSRQRRNEAGIPVDAYGNALPMPPMKFRKGKADWVWIVMTVRQMIPDIDQLGRIADGLWEKYPRGLPEHKDSVGAIIDLDAGTVTHRIRADRRDLIDAALRDDIYKEVARVVAVATGILNKHQHGALDELTVNDERLGATAIDIDIIPVDD